jgi:ATP-binding cassette subfamily A (ABC1) protein 1
MFPLLVLLMYVIPIHRLVMRVVNERQTRAKDMMRVMGMAEGAYWASWLLYHAGITAVIAGAVTLITRHNVLHSSDGGLVFAFFWLYSLSLFGYSIFMSSLFRRSLATTPSLVSNLLYFFTHFCDYAVQSPYQARYHKILASFLPSIAMKRAVFNIARFEKASKGL